MTSEIDPKCWVETICDMSERQLLAQHADTGRANICFKNSSKAGTFGEISLSSLRAKCDRRSATTTIIDESPQAWPEFVIRVRNPKDSSDLSLFDTSALQLSIASANDRPVMFQVASNFNCQENGSPLTNIYGGTYLTHLMCDATQGPSAAAGAGAGAIERWLCHREQPINLLGDIKEFGVENGKLQTIDPTLSHANNTINFDLVKIGVHTDIDANFDRSKRNSCIYHPKAPRTVDQVFVSTVCMRLFRNSKRGKKVADVAMRQLLRAAYDGTYLAARLRNTSVLVLTLVGGGVFENPLSEIAMALATAHVRYAYEGGKSNLQTVLLPLFDRSVDYKSIVKSLIAAGCPESSIKVQFS